MRDKLFTTKSSLIREWCAYIYAIEAIIVNNDSPTVLTVVKFTTFFNMKPGLLKGNLA